MTPSSAKKKRVATAKKPVLPPHLSKLLKSQKLLYTRTIQADSRSTVYEVRPEGEADSRQVLKFAMSNPKLTLSMRNQVLWTNQVQKLLPAKAAYGIAPVIDHGYVEDRYYWQIVPYVEGTPFAIMKKGISQIQVEHPEQYFPKIVDLINFYSTIKPLSLHGIDLRVGKTSRTDKLSLLEEVIALSRNYTPYLSELLQIIDKNYRQLKSVNSHNDLSEINIIIDKNQRVILIDADHGNSSKYQYYDVADFYYRLYARACRPDLARAFLKSYLASVKPALKLAFLNNFLCLSAQRCVGNTYELEELLPEQHKLKRRQMAKKFAEDIISYRIIDI